MSRFQFLASSPAFPASPPPRRSRRPRRKPVNPCRRSNVKRLSKSVKFPVFARHQAQSSNEFLCKEKKKKEGETSIRSRTADCNTNNCVSLARFRSPSPPKTRLPLDSCQFEEDHRRLSSPPKRPRHRSGSSLPPATLPPPMSYPRESSVSIVDG